MKKIMLIGKSGSGKTTLIQSIKQLPLKYSKTQAIEYIDGFIDLPGEYLENRGLYRAIIVTSSEADMIGLVMDASNEDNWFPEGFATMFSKPVIGIITKIDKEDANILRAKSFLIQAGAKKIIETSAYNREGIEMFIQWTTENEGDKGYDRLYL